MYLLHFLHQNPLCIFLSGFDISHGVLGIISLQGSSYSLACLLILLLTLLKLCFLWILVEFVAVYFFLSFYREDHMLFAKCMSILTTVPNLHISN